MKFRKKPVVIEAIQYVFDEQKDTDNVKEICEFMGVKSIVMRSQKIIIMTPEGDMTASNGDWIIKGVNGEFYPCKPDVFEKTYEPYELEQLPQIVTDDPQGNMSCMRNMVFIKGKEVYLRGIGEDYTNISLVEYCKEEYKRLYDTEIEADTSEFGDYMDDDSLLSLFYWTCVGFAETREKLKQHENMYTK